MHLLLIICSLSFANALPTKQSQDVHNIFRESDTHSLLRKAPDPEPHGDTGYTLNSEWSSDPENHAPIAFDPISPFNDNGRSQMVDNFVPAPWINHCPALALNCNRCPRELSCSLPLSATVIAPPIVQPTPQPAGVGEYNAVTGQQDSDVPTAADQQSPPCSLQKYSETDVSPCEPGALCKKGHCACPRRKDQDFGLKSWIRLRGWSWPEALNVFVNPDVPCEPPCDTLFCGEVRRGRGCKALQSSRPGSVDDTVPDIIAAQENYTSVIPLVQSVIIGTLISTLQNRISTSASKSLGQTVWTARGVPVTSYASQASLALSQSTSRCLPTGGAKNDAISLPIIPGGMGAVQKPGIPPAMSGADADYVSGVADLNSIGENV